MRVRYSEIFFSFQGEAKFAGVPAVWLRFFGCNLNCSGFGQKNPTDPSTYELPYEAFDETTVTKVEQLPVWKFGCDSSYSWAVKFKHLAQDADIPTIADRLIDANRSPSNPEGKFVHPVTGQPIMLCFTGGEPMMQQKAMIEIIRELVGREYNVPIVTVETNATRKLSPELKTFINEEYFGTWHWAMSPKLFNVSGEADVVDDAVIVSYCDAFWSSKVLKFVVDGRAETWAELDDHLNRLRESFKLSEDGELPDVWIMPVGATKEAQELPTVAEIAMEAMRRGFNVATRNHVAVFGNKIGT